MDAMICFWSNHYQHISFVVICHRQFKKTFYFARVLENLNSVDGAGSSGKAFFVDKLSTQFCIVICHLRDGGKISQKLQIKAFKMKK